MIVNVIGLGLIGGSFCKAVKQKTVHTCHGWDINPDVLNKALREGAIDCTGENLSLADLTIVCLYPEAAIRFLLDNCANFKAGSIVVDACGVKAAVVEAVSRPLHESGVIFIGGHPMAGREFSGFDYSSADLFEKASLILTPSESTPPDKLDAVRELAQALSFKKVVCTTAEEHDAIIAYTSQLAHVVSNAYVKSPTLSRQLGFSAGSFKDLTRVAKLNEDMWTSLFLLNRAPLLYELETLAAHLEEYRKALEAGDEAHIRSLLRDGRILKERSLEENF